MKQHFDHHWLITLPDDWIAEDEDGCVALYHPDGAGMLEISADPQAHSIANEDLHALAAEHLDAGARVEATRAGEFDGIELSYDDAEGNYWREWYLKCDNLLLFVTYNCDTGDEEREEGLLEVILATLRRKRDPAPG
ncbi:MAG: hypothetical protein ACFCUJ_02840 [Thiotrichales bacterium]